MFFLLYYPQAEYQKNPIINQIQTWPQHRTVCGLFVRFTGCFPVRHRRSAGAGGNGEGIAQLHEEAHAQAGIAVGVWRPASGGQATQPVARAEKGEYETIQTRGGGVKNPS